MVASRAAENSYGESIGEPKAKLNIKVGTGLSFLRAGTYERGTKSQEPRAESQKKNAVRASHPNRICYA